MSDASAPKARDRDRRWKPLDASPVLMPRIWWKILVLVLTRPRPIRVRAKRLAILGILTLGGLTTRIALWLDRFIYPECVSVEIREPVFIVGNARSGTTTLHRLLSGDRRKFTTFRLWEMLFPSLLQKRLVSAAMKFFEAIAPGTHARLVAWEERQFEGFKRLNPMGINKSQEDELMLMPLFATPTLTILFPYLVELAEMEHFDQLPAHERKAILEFYRQCVQRQLAFHDDGATFLSKNPTFIAKLRSLLDEFPDARILYAVRDPMETIPSLLKMMQYLWRGLGFDKSEIERSSQSLVDGSIKDYHYAAEVLASLPPDRYLVVEFEDFVTDPEKGIHEIYRHFGWTMTDEFRHWLAAEAPERSPKASGGGETLAEYGFDGGAISSRIESAAAALDLISGNA